MSDAGAGSSHGGSQGGGGSQGEGQQVDPGRKYGTIVNNNANHWKCIFCYKVLTAGVSRLKQHLVGGYKNAKKCPICPEHVRVELQTYMARKVEERVALSMQYQPVVNEDDVEDLDGDDEPMRKGYQEEAPWSFGQVCDVYASDILKGRKRIGKGCLELVTRT
ncbi:unnamed protein product [Brassica napus]|uniref:(rape) hypothetical protein n=1 Tax=Brassica napus TaxID=3708 RepID=A0A817A750_BRANA|nr:unnamed protein product [Brassica napus]